MVRATQQVLGTIMELVLLQHLLLGVPAMFPASVYTLIGDLVATMEIVNILLGEIAPAQDVTLQTMITVKNTFAVRVIAVP
jgi:hypothetical protein